MKMTKEKFKQIITQIINIYQETETYIDQLLDLKIDLIETPLYEYSVKFLDLLVDILIEDDNKQEVFYGYIFEYLPQLKEEGRVPCQINAQMWDENNNPMCYDIDSLVDYLYES